MTKEKELENQSNETPEVEQLAIPKSYFVPSIIATVLCCPPTGVLGIINAARVERFYQQKRYSEAELASRNAYKWIKISLFAWIVCIALYMIVAVLFNGQALAV